MAGRGLEGGAGRAFGGGRGRLRKGVAGVLADFGVDSFEGIFDVVLVEGSVS